MFSTIEKRLRFIVKKEKSFVEIRFYLDIVKREEFVCDIYSISMKNQRETIVYGLPLIITLSIILTRNSALYFSSLLFLVAYGIGRLSNQNKKRHKIIAIYKLLLFFWILTILDMLIPNIYFTLQLFFYTASLGLFIHILQKVLHILKGEKQNG